MVLSFWSNVKPRCFWVLACSISDLLKNEKDESKELLKLGLSPSKKKKCFICFNDSPSKAMKNAFYFILKALLVLKIFKFLSWFFGHVVKTAWLEC